MSYTLFNKLRSFAGKKGNVHVTLFLGEGCYTMVKYIGLLLLSWFYFLNKKVHNNATCWAIPDLDIRNISRITFINQVDKG